MGSRRRDFFRRALTGTGLLASATAWAGQGGASMRHPEMNRDEEPVPETGAGESVAVETPDVHNLPYALDNNVKVFHLVAEPVKRKILPYKTMDVWGYNGTCPGPTIQVTQGDRVRIILDNHLPESTSMHWHGFEIPVQMDGMPYISQKPVPPGGHFIYEFDLHQQGTFFYHSHGAMQEMMGMIGMFIMHPKVPQQPRVDHDFGIILQEWAILPGSTVPNTANMEFNWLTFNGVASPMTTPMVVRLGSRVRIRLVNLGMDHHPIHLHGHTFAVTGTEGGRMPAALWTPGNTVLVGVAQARDIEFVANNPGDWMLHCHLPHHMMNSMSDLLGSRMTFTADLEDPRALSQMQTLANTIGVEHIHHAPISPNANSVLGFPQDAFMEMGMDKAVDKPENYGLPFNWSADMMGMMSLVRVLPGEAYQKIQAMKRSRVPPEPARSPHLEHQNG
jgi:FtsP/CotA-like multicopper oxidase with cupredoxin domain